MRIIKANITHAGIVGEIHSKAWIQTYKDLFPTEYLEQLPQIFHKPELRDDICSALQKVDISFYEDSMRPLICGISDGQHISGVADRGRI